MKICQYDPNNWADIIKMRYSTELKYRKYGKKLMDTATKTWIDAAKTASERVVQKTAEATGNLIRNKIADKITSAGKTKRKKKKMKGKKFTYHQKRRQIIDDVKLF